jgi:hypothetical protein
MILLRFLVFLLALLILLFTSGPSTSQPEHRVALVGATGSAALDAVRGRMDGFAFTNWWEAAQSDADTPFRVVFFDPATLDDAALRWSWQAFERGVVFVGVGASYAEMRYVTGGLCTARGAVLPVNLPETHAIVFYLSPDAEPDAVEADLRGCVLPEGDFPPRGLAISEGVLTAPLNDTGLDVLLATVEAVLGEG